MRSRALLGSLLFFVVGPGLEAGVGPWLLTGGWTDGGAPAALRGVGVALIAAGLALLLACFGQFVREGAGTPSPAAPPERLVVGGPYRHVRNPMYVATTALIAGQGLALGRPILLVAAAVYALALGGLDRWFERPRLAHRFGAEYDAYVRAVPGWLPRRTPWEPA